MSSRRMPARPVRRPLIRVGAATGAAALVALGLGAPASAHVTVTPSDTAAGAYTVLTFSVGHGCEGSPTTAIDIQIPEGINAVTPTRNDYYDVAKRAEQLNPPVADAHGNEITERIDTVTYTARTPLPDGFRDTFELSVQLPEDAEGETLLFPVIQSCVKGETAWTEVAADGQSEDDLDSPAPLLVVTEAGEGGHHGAAEEESEDDAAEGVSVTEASGEPLTEAADGDDSGNGLAIAGLVAGVGGLLLGGAALARGRRTA